MAMPSAENANFDSLESLDRMLRRTRRMLPRQEWGLLSLVHRRGATQGELAAALGISRASLRKRVLSATRRATNPLLMRLARQWRRLEPPERRLVYLRLVLGLSYREIARRGLVPDLVRGDRPASASSLRRNLARIERWLAPPPPTRLDTQTGSGSTESNPTPARTGP
jgi:hypothetical protein